MKRILFALVAALLLAGCPSKGTNAVSEKGKKTGPVLARVGTETLTRDELLLLFRGQVPPDAPREKLQQVLESWVNGEIWYQEAERRGIGKDETTQMALRNETHLLYKCTAEYDKASDGGIRWDDPDIAVEWPLLDVFVSAKDASLPFLKELS